MRMRSTMTTELKKQLPDQDLIQFQNHKPEFPLKNIKKLLELITQFMH